jgi:large subunit ribosomal protein L9
MKVILLQDVENVGKKYEIKDVKSGYARNFLIPTGMAKPATANSMKWLETQREIEEKKAEEELKKTQGVASAMDGQEVIISVKVGDEQQLFESITVQKIAEKLKELGFEIKKNQIGLEKPIKELGEFPVKIKFEHNLECEIRVIITEDKSEE